MCAILQQNTKNNEGNEKSDIHCLNKNIQTVTFYIVFLDSCAQLHFENVCQCCSLSYIKIFVTITSLFVHNIRNSPQNIFNLPEIPVTK